MADAESKQIKGASIEVTSLSKYFGKFGAVVDANLDIEAGMARKFLEKKTQ